MSPPRLRALAGSSKVVAVTVDARTNDDLDEIVAGASGHAAASRQGKPERVLTIKAVHNVCPVIKAMSVRDADDLRSGWNLCRHRRPLPVRRQAAQPARSLPGGNGVSFDWGADEHARLTIARLHAFRGRQQG
jgi:phosphoribosylanthranilate isomerase